MGQRGSGGGAGGGDLLLALLALTALPPAAACLHALRRPPYETYWLGTYPESRFLSLTCFAIRGFRWTLKFIKVTYENWDLEMEYAKCMSENYGLTIPLFTPPWSRHSRALTDTHQSDRKHDYFDELSFAQMVAQKQLPTTPKNSKTDLQQKLTSGRDVRTDLNKKSWQDKSDEYITSLQPMLFVNNNVTVPASNILPFSEIESQQELMRIVKSLYQILLSLVNEIQSQLFRTFGSGILSCTRKYIRGAFWRWVDSAPFLK